MITNHFINQLGVATDFTSRQSRFDSLSIVSRQSVLAILLLCLTLGVGNAWGANSGLTASPGVFVIDFYNSSKLTATSGTTLDASGCQSHLTVPTGVTASDVVTGVANTGTVRYDMNGGLTLGTSSTGKSQTTLTIGSNYPIRKIIAVGTQYGSDGAPLYVAGTSVTLNTGQTAYASCSKSTTITPGFITSLVIKQNNGSNKKRATLYTAVCEYGYRAYLTAPGSGSIAATPKTANENGAGYNSDTCAVMGLKSGQKVTLTATPPSGYEVDEWTIRKKSDNSNITASVLSGTTLTMPAYDVKVSVTWKASCTSLASINGSFF